MHKCNPLAHNGIECELYAYTCGVCVLLGPATAQAVCVSTRCLCVAAAPCCWPPACCACLPAALLCVCAPPCAAQRVRRCLLLCGRSLVGVRRTPGGTPPPPPG